MTTPFDMRTYIEQSDARFAAAKRDAARKPPEEITTRRELDDWLRSAADERAALAAEMEGAVSTAVLADARRRLAALDDAEKVAKARSGLVARQEFGEGERRKAETADRAFTAEAEMLLVVDPLIAQFVELHDRIVAARAAAIAAGARAVVAPEDNLAAEYDGAVPPRREWIMAFHLLDHAAYLIRTTWLDTLPEARARMATLDTAQETGRGRPWRRRS
jgi:hypothetical protein